MTMDRSQMERAVGACQQAVRVAGKRSLRPIRSATGITGVDPSSLEHALFMGEELLRYFATGRREKAMRWLGHLQGALVVLGLMTLEEAKKRSMPIEDATTAWDVSAQDARAIARALRINPLSSCGLPKSLPTPELTNAYAHWLNAKDATEIARFANILADLLDAWANRPEHFTVARARRAARSLRAFPLHGHDELTDSFPTQELREQHTLYACSDSDEEAKVAAKRLVDLLEEWADQKEAESKPQSMERAAVVEEQTTPSALLTRDRARAIAALLRSAHTQGRVGVRDDELPTAALQDLHHKWLRAESVLAVKYAAEDYARGLEVWAAAQLPPVCSKPSAPVRNCGIGIPGCTLQWTAASPDKVHIELLGVDGVDLNALIEELNFIKRWREC